MYIPKELNDIFEFGLLFLLVMKQVLLFLCGKTDDCAIDQFLKLKNIGDKCKLDVFFLYHQKDTCVPMIIQNYPHYIFRSDVLFSMGYKPISDSLIPGSNHFPLLKFYKEFPQYDYYWLVEDDVRFTGDWSDFFDAFEMDNSDFISSYLRKYADEPDWPWWGSLKNCGTGVETCDLVHTFNPIYRISNRALERVDKCLKDGWSGHHEVLFPTLLAMSGMSVRDFNDGKSMFYFNETFSHLPLKPQDVRHNVLYHPIKEKYLRNLHKVKQNCVISAVGNNSLHEQWISSAADSNFDIHLIVYDWSYNKWYNGVDFISYRKGYKMKLVYDYLLSHPEYIEHYDYFFILDDDISTDAIGIEKIFRLMKKYQLEIAQPALKESYYTYPQTLRDKMCALRYTNFVEIMAPCFSRQALKSVLETFNANESGWGIEYHWPFLINSNKKDIAIIDSASMVHTRPIQSFSERNYRDLYEYLKNNNLTKDITEYDAVPFDESQYSCKAEFNEERAALKNSLLSLKEYACKIVNKLSSSCRISMNGTVGMALYLALYSRISEDKKFADWALHIIEREGMFLDRIKNDMSLFSGLPGFCWSIEWLAQNGFIYNNTSEILDEIIPLVNETAVKQLDSFSENQLKELGLYYELRCKNIENNRYDSFVEEEHILKSIYDRLHDESYVKNVYSNGLDKALIWLYSSFWKEFNIFDDSSLDDSWSLMNTIYETYVNLDAQNSNIYI